MPDAVITQNRMLMVTTFVNGDELRVRSVGAYQASVEKRALEAIVGVAEVTLWPAGLLQPGEHWELRSGGHNRGARWVRIPAEPHIGDGRTR